MAASQTEPELFFPARDGWVVRVSPCRGGLRWRTRPDRLTSPGQRYAAAVWARRVAMPRLTLEQTYTALWGDPDPFTRG